MAYTDGYAGGYGDTDGGMLDSHLYGPGHVVHTLLGMYLTILVRFLVFI